MAEELENKRSSFLMADLLVLPSLRFRNPSYPALKTFHCLCVACSTCTLLGAVQDRNLMTCVPCSSLGWLSNRCNRI